MKVIDLFAGIGGFSLAAHWVGWETALFCEIEEFPRKVLAKNFPGIPIHDDIKTLTYEKYKYLNLDPNELILTGGFPCQPFSTAGARKGNEDDRALWPEMLRVIREFQPAWVVGENVAGIVSMEDDETLERILDSLEDEGYHTQVFLIPACGVEAIHRRDRIWIVGKRNTVANASKKCREQKTNQREINRQEWKQVRSISPAISEARTSSNAIGIGRERGEKFRGFLEVWQKPVNKQSSGLHERSNWKLSTEPTICRTNDGVSGRMDRNRLKALGNAIVPQVAYEIFKAIQSTQS